MLNNGDFLVRDSTSQKGEFVLTCQWRSAPLHFKINRQSAFDSVTGAVKTQYLFESKLSDSVTDLVNAHMHDGIVISEASGALIRTPVNRRVSADSYSCIPSQSSPLSTGSAIAHTVPAPSSYEHSSQLLSRSKRAGSQPFLDDYSDLKPDRNVSNSRGSDNGGGFFTSDNVLIDKRVKPAACRHNRSGSEPVEHDMTTRGSTKLQRSLFTVSHSQLPTTAKSIDALSAQSDSSSHSNGSDAAAGAPPPKPSRIPTVKLKKTDQRPKVQIRNRKLYEDDGKDYSDYDQVKSWTSAPSTHNSQQQLSAPRSVGSRQDQLMRSSSASTDSGVVTDTNHQAPMYDSVADPTTPRPPLMPKPDMNPVSRFDLTDYVSQILTPNNKPLEGSAKATIKALLLDTKPEVLALHLTLLDLDLFKVFALADQGVGVFSGLQLITLPQGQRMRQDALERSVVI